MYKNNITFWVGLMLISTFENCLAESKNSSKEFASFVYQIPEIISIKDPLLHINVSKAAELKFLGGCHSKNRSLPAGVTSVKLDKLADGFYDGCYLEFTYPAFIFFSRKFTLKIPPFTVDTTRPELSLKSLESTAELDHDSKVTLISSEEGYLNFYGSCFSKTNYVYKGENIIFLDTSEIGTISECKLQVRDLARNISISLEIKNIVSKTAFGIVSTDVSIKNDSFEEQVYAKVYGIALQEDGKIIVVGDADFDKTGRDFLIIRYNADGTLDPTFDSDGLVTTDIDFQSNTAYSVAIQKDGKIIVAGVSSKGKSSFAFARYNIDGSLDPKFGNAGIVTIKVGALWDKAFSVALQTDGKILASGSSMRNIEGGKMITHGQVNATVTNDFALVRLKNDGNLDTSFNRIGMVTTSTNDLIGEQRSVAVQSDGKILVGGSGYFDQSVFALIRYNKDGKPDETFSDKGILTTAFDKGVSGQRVAIQTDGKILMLGTIYSRNSNSISMARYTKDGELDTTFSNDGIQTTNEGFNGCGLNFTTGFNGKIFVVGQSNYDFSLFSFDNSGNLEKMVTTPIFRSSNDCAYGVAVQKDGKIIVAGSSNSNKPIHSVIVLVRYNPDLTIDTAFGRNLQ